MARLGAGVAALVIAALVMTGCSSEDPSNVASAASTSATPSPPASRSSSPTSPTTASPIRSRGAASNCLFSVARVSRVLGGSWQRHPGNRRACAYRSDRGAVFATSTVDQAIKPGLREARRACVAHVKPIAVAGGGFVCVERHASGDLVVGNTGARGRLWILVIAPTPGGTYKAELAAMAALIGAVPK